MSMSNTRLSNLADAVRLIQDGLDFALGVGRSLGCRLCLGGRALRHHPRSQLRVRRQRAMEPDEVQPRPRQQRGQPLARAGDLRHAGARVAGQWRHAFTRRGHRRSDGQPRRMRDAEQGPLHPADARLPARRARPHGVTPGKEELDAAQTGHLRYLARRRCERACAGGRGSSLQPARAGPTPPGHSPAACWRAGAQSRTRRRAAAPTASRPAAISAHEPGSGMGAASSCTPTASSSKPLVKPELPVPAPSRRM
jgi:hypothetical protein